MKKYLIAIALALASSAAAVAGPIADRRAERVAAGKPVLFPRLTKPRAVLDDCGCGPGCVCAPCQCPTLRQSVPQQMPACPNGKCPLAPAPKVKFGE